MRINLKKMAALLMTVMLAPSAWANQELFNEQLVRIINQLNATLPLIKEAARFQTGHEPIKLHLTSFKDVDNRLHNGVSEDIELIKKGLIAYLNKPAIAPKKVTPIEGDFIDSPKKRKSL